MTKYAETLLNFLDTKGLRKSDLVNTLKIPDSTVRAWFSRDTMPAADVCYKVAKYLGVSVEYLLTGEDSEEEKEGKTSTSESKVSELEEKYNNLTDEAKSIIDQLIENPKNQKKANNTQNSPAALVG